MVFQVEEGKAAHYLNRAGGGSGFIRDAQGKPEKTAHKLERAWHMCIIALQVDDALSIETSPLSA